MTMFQPLMSCQNAAIESWLLSATEIEYCANTTVQLVIYSWTVWHVIVVATEKTGF